MRRLKSILGIMAVATFIVGAIACTNQEQNDNQEDSYSSVNMESSQITSDIEAISEEESNTIDLTDSEMLDSNSQKENNTIVDDAHNIVPDRKTMITTYQSVLQEVYDNHTFPDGNDYGFNDIDDISANIFAVYDIDGDGKDELIISYTTTAMAGMVEKIFDFDSNTNTVTEEFSQFPYITYYDNGVIEAGWSHNQGLAGDFWPYTLYQYDQEADSYTEVASVDAWDKSFAATDYSGNSFPDNIDQSNDGIVFYIMEGEEMEYGTPVSAEEYNLWREAYISRAEEAIEVPFASLTEENINSVK